MKKWDGEEAGRENSKPESSRGEDEQNLTSRRRQSSLMQLAERKQQAGSSKMGRWEDGRMEEWRRSRKDECEEKGETREL